MTAHALDDAPLSGFHKKLTLYSSGGPFLDGYIWRVPSRAVGLDKPVARTHRSCRLFYSLQLPKSRSGDAREPATPRTPLLEPLTLKDPQLRNRMISTSCEPACGDNEVRGHTLLRRFLRHGDDAIHAPAGASLPGEPPRSPAVDLRFLPTVRGQRGAIGHIAAGRSIHAVHPQRDQSRFRQLIGSALPFDQ